MRLLTATEVAKRLGKTDKTVRTWVKDGKLSAVHINATQLGIREDDMRRIAATMGIELEDDRPARPGDDTAIQERINILEQELAELRKEVALLKGNRVETQIKAPVHDVETFPTTTPDYKPVKRAVSPIIEDNLPPGTIYMRVFAVEHGVNPRTMLDHVVKGIAGDRLDVTERPKANRPKETERLLTPAQQAQAIAFWQRHDVSMKLCSNCPHEHKRFYIDNGGNGGTAWAVYDSEISHRINGMIKPDLVQWCHDEQAAQEKAQELNRTRGHAIDEPKCTVCGAQPAGGSPVRCASCHSRLERD